MGLASTARPVISAAGRSLSGAAMLSTLGGLALMTTVDVTSYNVLSSHLAGPDHFRACDPKNLAERKRYERLLRKLREDLDQRAIICLQEVSQTWEGRLHAAFAKEGYYFVTQLYGNPFNNYMGVGIAVPMDRYTIEGVDLRRISDSKPWPRAPEPIATAPGPTDLLRSVWRFLTLPLRAAGRSDRQWPEQTIWEKAKRRFNAQVAVKLTDVKSGDTFSVSTYHMPCMFRDPQVMTIHAALSAQQAHRAAEGLPYILAGDFNIQPGTPQYNLLTRDGDMDPASPDYPAPPAHEPWRPTLPETLRSAYAENLGSEPAFTNWAKVQDNPEFIECLDYIFLSSAWTVLGVGATPVAKTSPGPYPSETEPSDHVKISATLELKKTAEAAEAGPNEVS